MQAASAPSVPRDDGPGGPRTYVTVCSSEEYLDGVLALDASLRRVGSRYPLTVLVTAPVSAEAEQRLNLLGIRTSRRDESPAVPREVIDRNAASGQEHWSRTFDKLHIFELLEFGKVVYLDSDMIVMSNVDELFDRPHLSAVAAGRSQPGNESWVQLNSGCLVVVPRPGALEALWKALPLALSERGAVGDQDLIQVAHPDWPEQEDLHLGEEYNLFFMYLEHYTRELGYSRRGGPPIKIVHFVGARKPWMWSSTELARTFARHVRRRQWGSLLVMARYQLVLRQARHRFSRAGT